MNWPTAQAPESVMLFLVDVFQYMFHTICRRAGRANEISTRYLPLFGFAVHLPMCSYISVQRHSVTYPQALAASDTAELSGAFGCMLVASSPGAASTGKELNRMIWASGYLE